MKTQVLGTLALGAVALTPTLGAAQTQQTPTQGGGQAARISLRIASPGCGALSPIGGGVLNPNPSDVNDGDLDDVEILAIQQGCTLRAIVTDARGQRLAGQNLILTRSAATGGIASFPFGRPRVTNAQGQAIWKFQPTPNTDFIYEVRTAREQGPFLQSNPVQIQLCTGEDSVGVVPGAPVIGAGRGCQNQEDGDNGDGITFGDDDTNTDDDSQNGDGITGPIIPR